MSSIFQTGSHVDVEIDILFKELRKHPTDSKEYAAVLDQIAKLHKLKSEETSQRVSPDTLVIAAVNLLGIVMILKHEELNVITTKAMNLVPKPR